jgi:hypothetical protein
MPRSRKAGGPTALKQWPLTAQAQALILASIRAGAFPSVAAEAAGIPARVFEQWLEWGNPLDRPRGWRRHKVYTPLCRAVKEARAQARLAAEMHAMQDDPIAWLRSGPGKERPNDPGWTMPIRPQPMRQTNNVNVFLAPEMQGVMASILAILAPYLEARAAIADALAKGHAEPKRVELVEG